MSRAFSAVIVTAFGALGACQDPPPQSPSTAHADPPMPAASATPIAIMPSASATPVASAAPVAPPSTSAAPPPPPPAPRGAKIAMFVARTLKAPVRPPHDPNVDIFGAQPQPVDLSQVANSCGVSVSDSSNIKLGTGTPLTGIGSLATEYIQIGLTPKPGQTPPERARAMGGIEMIESNVARCLPALARKNPKLFAAPITVDARSAGNGAETIVTTPKTTAADVTTCITTSVRPALAGDEAAAHIVFTIRIDKPPPP